MSRQPGIEPNPLSFYASPGLSEERQGLLIAAELDPDLVEDSIGMLLDRIDLGHAERLIRRKHVTERHGTASRGRTPVALTTTSSSRIEPTC
jgi:hypothetical protein